MVDPIKVYPSKPAKVYFYGTCLVDMFYPDAGIAGVSCWSVKALRCCFRKTRPAVASRPTPPATMIRPDQ